MRKNMFKSILKLSFFGTMLFTLLSTVYPMKADAADSNGSSYVKEAVFVRSEKGYEFAEHPDYTGNEGSRKILNSNYSVFCCAHGTSVAKSNTDEPMRVYTIGGIETRADDEDEDEQDVNETDNPELATAIQHIRKIMEGETVKTANGSVTPIFVTESTLEVETPAGYKKVGHGEAEDDYLETWIIANLSEDNKDHNNPMQYAWWCTPSGYRDQYGTENEYYRSAVKFKEYILSVSNGKYRSQKYYKDYTGYNINPPKWKDTNPVVSYHPAKDGEDAFYLIGPYAFEGYKYMNDGDNLHVDFCKVNSFKVKTDKSNGYVEAKKSKDDKDGDRNLLIVSKEIDKNGNEIILQDVNFPDDGKNFYIKMYDKGRFKGSTAIKDIKIDFRYVNAWAYFNFLEGDKNKYQFKEMIYKDTHNPDGMWVHELKAVRKGTGVQSQTLATDACGLYWFEIYELHRGMELNTTKINIIKRVVDKNGDPIDAKYLDDDKFSFELNVSGAKSKSSEPEKQTLTVSTKNPSAESYTYYWGDESENVPTFTLKESEVSGNKHKYRFVKAEKIDGDKTLTVDSNGVISGKMDEGTINIYFDNEIAPKQGYIDIEKVIEDKDKEVYGQTINENRTFKFNITVEGDFYYGTNHYKGGEKLVVNDFEVTVENGKLVGKRSFNDENSPIYWYGEAPRVNIEENETANYESAEAITDGSKKYAKSFKMIGTDVAMDDNGVLTFKKEESENVRNVYKETFKNKDVIHKAAELKIIKRVDISSIKAETSRVNLMLSAIKKLNFTFQIDVIDGEQVTTLDNAFILEGASAAISEDGNFIEIVKPYKGEIKWVGTTAPDYRITEINVPAGTEFVSAKTEGQKTEGEPEHSVRGTFREGATADETIDNTIINKLHEHKGKINLSKIFGTLTDEESKTKINEAIKNGGVLLFNVDIEGEFLYGVQDPVGVVADKKIRLIGKVDGADYKIGSFILLQPDGKPDPTIEKDEEKSIVMTPEVTVEKDENGNITNVTYTNNSAVTDDIIWYGENAPSYKVNEDVSKLGVDVIIPKDVEGKFEVKDEDGSETSVDVVFNNTINKPDLRYANLIINKKLFGSEGLNIEDYKDKNYTFKFIVNVYRTAKDGTQLEQIPSEKDKVVNIEGVQVGENSMEWIWNGEDENDLIYWDPAEENEPYITVDEVLSDGKYTIPEGVTFDSANVLVGSGETPTVDAEYSYYGKVIETADNKLVHLVKTPEEGSTAEDDRKIPLKNLDDDKKIFTVQCNFNNKLSGPDITTSKLNIIKKLAGKDADSMLTTATDDKPFSFKVTITAEHEFEYLGKTYPAGKYYLSDDGIVTDESKGIVTIKVEDEESKSNNWMSPEFIWDNKDAEGKDIHYDVEEINLDSGIEHTITNKEGVLKSAAEINVECTNIKKEPKTAKLKIIKTVPTDEITEERAQGYVFSFAINVDGYAAPINVALSYKGAVGGLYTWETEIEGIVLKDDGETKAQIQEINVPEGFRFLKFEGESDGQNSKTITLKPDGTVAEVTCRNEYVKPKTMKGRIDIHKEVTSDALNGQEFSFTVKLNGASFKANYGSETSGGSYVTSHTFSDVKVKVGETASIDVEWPEGVSNPQYEVKENVSDDATYEVKDIKNSTGTVPGVLKDASEAPSTTVTVNAVNGPKMVGGYIKFRKAVKASDTHGNNALNDIKVNDEFTFKVEISYDNGETKQTIATPTITPNGVWVSDRITWELSKRPLYYITEVNVKEGYKVEGEVDGEPVPIAETPESVPADEVATITNVVDIKHGKFKVDKHIIGDLKVLDVVDMPKFEFKATVKGEFFYKNVYYSANSENKELVINFTLESTDPKDVYTSFELPEDIYWASEAAPTVYIEEINVKSPWKYLGISDGGKSGASLINDATVSFAVSNGLICVDEKVFRLDIGGTVWEDEEYLDNKNDTRSKNGSIDNGEKRIEGIEVYVYENGQLADLRDSTGVVIQQPIYTDKNGNWSADGIQLSTLAAKKYHVEFVYDGQSYEPTTFLAHYNYKSNSEKANAYMTNSDMRETYNKDSMAIDKNRDEVNNRINEIYGYSAITGDGKTVGEVKSTTGETNKINYQANISDLDAYAQSDKIESLKSRLQTRDSSGKIYDVFKAVASTDTSEAQLRFPVNNAVRIDKHTKVIEERDGENVLVDRTEYVATGTYMKHINLGLVKRPDAGLMTTKKLTSANVVTRNGIVHYEFKKLTDIVNESGVLKRQFRGIDLNEDNYTYGREEMSLYAPDYYYREEIYQYDPNYSYYANRVKDTEMEVYLNYVLTVVNESTEYKVKINSINDYFDSSLELVNDTISIDDRGNIDSNRIYNDAGDIISNPTFNIADGPKFTNGDRPINGASWQRVGNDIKGSDGNYYSKMTANLGDNCILEPAGNTLSDTDRSRLDMNVTLKVKREKLAVISKVDNNNQVLSMIMAIATGNKSNVVEVANYSTLYKTTGKNAGKVDADSAADNVNIANYNEKYWYEDDTYAAPRLELTVDSSKKKTVSGKAWEDNSVKVNAKGLGQREDDEALIGGLTTEEVEEIPSEGKVFEYLWATGEPLESLGGLTVKEAFGFDSTTETSRVKTADREVGSYEFVGIPSGDFKTRFKYGDDKTKLLDKNDVTGSAIALTADGELFNKVVPSGTGATGYTANDVLGSAYTLTANYSAQDKDNTPAVYNGQDYKTTIYRYDNKEEGSDNNDARDNEDRRLQVMAKSTTITNYNSEVLAEANIAGGHHDELYRDYEMSADTDATSFKAANVVEAKYVDIGLVERPRNDIILDKEINTIKITTNDDKTIFDAEYNVDYVVADNVGSGAEKVLARFIRDGQSKYLMAVVTLDKVRSVNYDVMQELNKQEDKRTDYNFNGIDSVKNFRYINIDEDILQGSTITLEYKFTAINIGEDDYTTEQIANLSSGYNEDKTKTQETVLYELAKEVEEAKANKTYEPGMVLGAFYYTGDSEGLSPVKSRIRQIIDYADLDAVFDASYNNTRDSSWRNAIVSELAGSGVSTDRLLSKKITSVNKLYDKDNRAYIEDSKNNLVLSMDEMDEKDSNFDNSGFERELVPVTGENGKLDINNTTDSENAFASELFLVITRTVSSEDDANNLAFDNVAEIVKGMNTVGRRDIKVVSGNANPKYGEFTIAIKERDSSATELITFTPPTGIDANTNLMNQVLIMTTVALMIVGAGVIVIKRTMKD